MKYQGEKMLRCKNSEIEKAIQDLKRFSATSATGFYDRNGNYIILSFATEILKLDFEKNLAEFNVTKYSVTTNKLQKIIRDFLKVNDFTVQEYLII